jgi:phosphoribosylformylglycinamidine cyclo-ligase
MDKKVTYDDVGVSHTKEDVHKAIKNLDKGIFPNAFCKIMEDVNQDPNYCCVFHSDSAGTKSSLAYLMYQETGDPNYFKGIVQDAVVMNVDDVLCVGVDGNSLLTNTIGRNKKLIPGEIIEIIIKELDNFTKKLTNLGFNVRLAGGETEDIGDLLRTLELGCSLFSRIPRSKIISASNISEEDVIIGLASSGRTSYEEKFNSGIGSNGLTLARHGTLTQYYAKKYPESYDNMHNKDSAFFGKYKLEDVLEGTPLSVGEALLSPTRTYSPVIIEVLKNFRKDIHAIFHNTGGGQSKCLGFGNNVTYVKNNMFKIPKIFQLIQESANIAWSEMYRVFNMGHRMEIIIPTEIAPEIIKISEKFQVEAQIIGKILFNKDYHGRNKLIIESDHGKFSYFSNKY